MSAETRYDKLLRRMLNGEKIMIDGGTGTEVERRGVPQLENAWNSGGSLSHPDIVRGIHEDYIRHGAEIIISNTFATSRNLMQDAGVADLFVDYNRRSVELALEACQVMGRENVLVAGSISHWSFSGRLPSLEELKSGAAEQAAIMRDAGADLIMLEMMIEVPRILAVLEGASSSGLPVWVGLSCAPDADGNMCLQARNADANGRVVGEPRQPMIPALDALKNYDIPVLSIMHTDVEDIHKCLDILDEHWQGLIGVYAHSGGFVDGRWTFEDTISPENFATAGRSWMDRDVRLIGGCCGIRPDHMQELGKRF